MGKKEKKSKKIKEKKKEKIEPLASEKVASNNNTEEVGLETNEPPKDGNIVAENNQPKVTAPS